MDLSSMAVYMVNCISSLVVCHSPSNTTRFLLIIVQAVLSVYEFTASRIEMLNAQIEAHMDTLVEEQVTSSQLFFIITTIPLTYYLDYAIIAKL